MYNKFFAGTIDITEMVLYLFFAFFFFLVMYLLREGRREGFPVEHDVTGELEPMPGIVFQATPKTFAFADGTTSQKPDMVREDHATSFKRTAPWSGSPIEPTGNPLTAGIGPGAYANRADRPDMTSHGTVRIAPLRASPEFFIDKQDIELRGLPLLGTDGVQAGIIADIWIDRAEYMVRYLEIALNDTKAANILVPMTMCVVQKAARSVRLDAVLGSQVAGAPVLANDNQITLLEEEKIVGYFGAGYLYATPERSESLI
jgi:photosynthetic reaction center H subunit